MDKSLNHDVAITIAHHANAIAQLQREIANGIELIKALESLGEGNAAISISTFVRPEDYHCTISNASAICLLRESIEIKQQQIEALTQSLRGMLS